MILNSKERIVDNTFTKEGRYFIMRGSEPSSFSPVSLASSDFDKSGFSLGADSQYFSQLLSPQGVPNEIITSEGPITSTRKIWARVTQIKNLTNEETITLPDFSSSWKPLTNYDNPEVGFADIVKSTVSGNYESENSPWKLGSLRSSSETTISLNGQGRELKHTWSSLKDQPVKQAEEILRPDIIAQQEFSQYINGMRLPPVVANSSGINVPLKTSPVGNFNCNRISSRTIRNRLIESEKEFLEVESIPLNFPSGVELFSKWIPVERRKFNISYSNNQYTLETAQALDVIKFDRNLYFIGKLVPVKMIQRPDVTTNAFLRIFTIIFEDGT